MNKSRTFFIWQCIIGKRIFLPVNTNDDNTLHRAHITLAFFCAWGGPDKQYLDYLGYEIANDAHADMISKQLQNKGFSLIDTTK